MAPQTIVTAAPGEREIVVERYFDAPRALVFEVWTQPHHVERWWGPNGFSIAVHEMDVRTGGAWRFAMHGPGGMEFQEKVVYIEVAKPERIVYAHGSDDGGPPQFTVTATFAEEGRGTRLVMRMQFPTAADRDRTIREVGAIEGAQQTVDRLAAYVATLGARTTDIPGAPVP